MKFIHTADTHLGFEFTRSAQHDPQGRRRRAGFIFSNLLEIAEHAIRSETDLFIHSGDLFNKHYIPREELERLICPILKVARMGIPVVIIPGNHERSKFPFDLFHGEADVFVFDRPKTLSLTLNGYAVGIAGFPYIRNDSGKTFLNALEASEYRDIRSDFNMLVTHQAFDQATVGPKAFTFKAGRPDTVSRAVVPPDFEYVAAGHIHRYQILFHPMKPRMKFVYPGSIQRITFAEMHEEKGFVEGEVLNDRIETRFLPLPAHDMEIVEIASAGLKRQDCENAIRNQFWRFDDDRVIRFVLTGGTKASDYPNIDFKKIRVEMPPVLECQFAVKTSKGWIQH